MLSFVVLVIVDVAAAAATAAAAAAAAVVADVVQFLDRHENYRVSQCHY